MILAFMPKPLIANCRNSEVDVHRRESSCKTKSIDLSLITSWGISAG